MRQVGWIFGLLLLFAAVDAKACVGDLVLPKPASKAQVFAFAAGQIIGRAEACGIDTRRYEADITRRIPQLARGHADAACAFFGFDHFLANLMYYQERHEMPTCKIVRALFKETKWSVQGLVKSQKAFKEATAQAVLKRSTARRIP